MNLNVLNEFAEIDNNELSNIPDELINSIYSLSLGYVSIISPHNRNVASLNDIYLFDSKNKSIRICLDFFKSVNTQMYQQLLSILTGQSEIKINFYNSNPLVISNRRSYNECFSPSFFIANNSSKTLAKTFTSIEFYLSNTIEDIYNLAHEVSHTFTSDLNRSSNDKLADFGLLHELLPSSIEQVLQIYLLDRNIISQDYANQRNIINTLSAQEHALIIQLRLSLDIAYANHYKAIRR